MRIALIVNEDRKDSPQLEPALLQAAADKHHLSFDLYVTKPKAIEETIKKILTQTYNAIVVGGGDGTVRTVVQYVMDSEIPLAVLPLGTFNYFARELKHPLDIEKIFALIKNKKTKLVDIGEVNEYIFINHTSIGFYTHILKLRKKHKETLGKNKLLKTLFTAFNFLDALPVYQLAFMMDKDQIKVDTCLVFIGNNQHHTDIFNFGDRPFITFGKLYVYILKCKNRWEVIKCIFRMLFNTFDKQQYLLQYETAEMLITAKSKQINTVIDGDLFKLDAPLKYAIRHKQLLVVASDD